MSSKTLIYKLYTLLYKIMYNNENIELNLQNTYKQPTAIVWNGA